MKAPKVTILNVAHPRWDHRIWGKEAITLKEAGILRAYEVADGLGDAQRDGVEIVDHGGLEGRGFWPRVRLVARVARRIRAERGEVIHFHDAVFLPGALWLKLRGRRIVYDVHEDYPRQVLNWELPSVIRRGMSATYWMLELIAGRLFDGIVAATPRIAARFPSRKTVLVQNYPVPAEFDPHQKLPYAERPPVIAYVGGIGRVRGIWEMLDAVGRVRESTPVRLKLAGVFSPEELEISARSHRHWDCVDYLGWLDRKGVADLLGTARIGLVLLHPVRDHLDAYPVKLFEYMAAGIPVIASDFPVWKDIVETSGCGLAIDPLDVEAVTWAMKSLLEHPERAQEMGESGRRAVLARYNWASERAKLLAFYANRMGVSCSVAGTQGPISLLGDSET
ncbi:MAG: glycosyltransferase family 4 protein [Candidatus Bipolaricaulota bacterium]